MPDITRIDTYGDPRFSQAVLDQHGAFLVDGEPYEVEVVGEHTARIRGARRELYAVVIEDFRFYAGHICDFYDMAGEMVAQYPPVERFAVKLDDLQPSQFYVDQEKLAAVRTFVKGPADVVVPVMPWEGRYISQDGHTRLAAAVDLGFDKVFAFIEPANGYILGFVEEARKRGVHTPYDLPVIPHGEYVVKWHRFCDVYFDRMAEED
ncbi:hypothetical protein [Acutalibacter caecimuris]|uniref:hypothetical protein n=1 Tax=Acutalibacter caecimuris TaxID=3093657 RepID=UPI002AC935AA|nr:hypothetical protein [Acutalibacter sp. M00118]